MTKRRSMVLIAMMATLVLSLIVAGIAAAGYKTGKYKGASEQTCFTTSPPDDYACPITLTATKLGVKKVTLEFVTECDDGSVWSIPTDPKKPAAAPITNGKRFQTGFEPGQNSGPVQMSVIVKGKLKGKKGKGKIKTFGSIEGVSCSSSAQWKAKKK